VSSSTSYPFAGVTNGLDGVNLDVESQLRECLSERDCLVIIGVRGNELLEVVRSETRT